MKVKILEEAGHKHALVGMSLSYKDRKIELFQWISEKCQSMLKRAGILAKKEGGHNKFLESIYLWVYIDAPRYFWSQFDTYRVGISKQSGSTMHTLTKRKLSFDDFAVDGITQCCLNRLNKLIEDKNWELAKKRLPESFRQERIVCLNYKNLRNIIGQRKNHRLEEWKIFCGCIRQQVIHPEYLEDIFENAVKQDTKV